MKFYADTGFVLSLHLPESTSTSAAAAMRGVSEPLPATPLVALEFRNALRLAVFRHKITETERATAWNSWQHDLAQGNLESTSVDAGSAYAEAETICDRFTATTGVRTLDLLHVACARVLAEADIGKTKTKVPGVLFSTCKVLKRLPGKSPREEAVA